MNKNQSGRRLNSVKEYEMNRFDLIMKLEEIKEYLIWEIDEETTDYAREKAYYCVVDAIDFLEENEE